MEHKILEQEYVEGEQDIVKTTHEQITYDTLTQQFIVDLGDGTWCEVWGKDRFSKAIDIATQYPTRTKGE